MAWVSPTGHYDASGFWSSPTNAYDDDTGTSTSMGFSDLYLELTHASLSCDKVRLWTNGNNWDIDVYYSGSWNNIHSGAMASGAWVEFSIGSTQDVTAMRAKKLVTGPSYIYEADFNEVAAPPPASPQIIKILLSMGLMLGKYGRREFFARLVGSLLNINRKNT